MNTFPRYLWSLIVLLFCTLVGMSIFDRAKQRRLLVTVEELRSEQAQLKQELTRIRSRNPVLEQRPATQPHYEFPTPSAAPADSKDNAARARDAELNAERILQLKKLHRRYDTFIKTRMMPTADSERFLSILADRENVNADVQSQIREQGLSDSASVEALREHLQNEVSKSLESLLGGDGAKDLSQYERTAFYRDAYVSPFLQTMDGNVTPLSADQVTTLTDLIAGNDHPYKRNPADIAMESQVNWQQVLKEASTFLSPSQLAALEKATAPSSHVP